MQGCGSTCRPCSKSTFATPVPTWPSPPPRGATPRLRRPFFSVLAAGRMPGCQGRQRTAASVFHASSVELQSKHTAPDTTAARNLFENDLRVSSVDDDDGRRNLIDYGMFAQMVLNTPASEVTLVWPELISPSITFADTLAMYRRAASEAQAIFGKYPGLAPLLLWRFRTANWKRVCDSHEDGCGRNSQHPIIHSKQGITALCC
jgi:hypothetical protein